MNFSFTAFLSAGNQVLGAMAKLRKAAVGFAVSVRMEQLGSHWTDFHEIWHLRIFRKYFEKIKFHWNLPRITGNLHQYQYTFMIISRSNLLGMKSVWDKSCRENQNTFYVQKLFFFRKSCLLWDNVQKFCRALKATDDSSIRRMRIACWITKAANTRSEYVIFIAFPLPLWLHVLASVVRYTYIGCLVYI